MYPVRVAAEDLSLLAVKKPYAAHDRNLTHSFHNQIIVQRWTTHAVENLLCNNLRKEAIGETKT
jgi:hypothetical protein